MLSASFVVLRVTFRALIFSNSSFYIVDGEFKFGFHLSGEPNPLTKPPLSQSL